MNLPKTVEVDVKHWCRFNTANRGKYDILGFLARKSLRNQGLKPTLKNIYKFLDSLNWNQIDEIHLANDELKGEERRKELRRLFKKYGIRLVFRRG